VNNKYLCNLIVPGAAKSGTSSLHEALHMHPEICMSEKKEPHYFCRSDQYTRGHKYHNSLFTPSSEERFFGESSTGYMIWPEAVEKIARELPDPKVILLLRHPVSRTVSHWKWRVKLGLENRPLMSAVENNGFGYNPDENDNGYGYMSYLQFSEYSKYCPLWIDKFGQNNCLIVTTDDFGGSFQSTMSRCFYFLGLDDFVFENELKANETKSIIRRPNSFMTSAMSILPSGLKSMSIYEKFRRSVFSFQASRSSVEVSDNDLKSIALLLKDDIEYFNMIKRY
jgi:hypothetical protein